MIFEVILISPDNCPKFSTMLAHFCANFLTFVGHRDGKPQFSNQFMANSSLIESDRATGVRSRNVAWMSAPHQRVYAHDVGAISGATRPPHVAISREERDLAHAGYEARPSPRSMLRKKYCPGRSCCSLKAALPLPG